MSQDFPNDAEGDALRRIASQGSDLSKPMLFDFQVAVPDEAAAKNLAQAAQKLGYRAAIYSSPECSLPCDVRVFNTDACHLRWANFDSKRVGRTGQTARRIPRWLGKLWK